MKRYSRISILSLIFCAVIFSCEKDSGEIDFILDDLQENKYYETEIFDELNLDIYGKWKLFDVSGGIHGNGHDLNFGFLEVHKFGIYGFIKGEDILEYGKIKVDEQNDTELLITFEPDVNSGLFMGDPEKQVNFSGKDTLSLDSPCCDRYNYHFKRIK